MEPSQTSRPEQIAKELASYVNLRIDSLKLNLIENLSHMFSSMLGLLVFVVLVSMSLMLLTVAFTFWLGTVIGSMPWAMIIVALFFMVVAIIVFALRRRLIADSMVRMFSRMFFNSEHRCDE